MDKLKQLMARCKCGVFLTVNEHRDYYLTAEERLEELASRECPPEYTDDVRKAMVETKAIIRYLTAVKSRIIAETNTIVELQFYPDTPIGSYSVIHHDLDAALDEALACLSS